MVECISSDIHDSYYIAQRYTTVNSFPLVADDIAASYSCVMKSIEEIRRENIRWLVRRDGDITQAELARRMEVSPTQVQQWKRGDRTPESDSCRRIEIAAKLPPGWMDQDHTPTEPRASSALDNNATPNDAPRYQVPVISWVRAGAFAAMLDVRSMEDVSQWVPMDTKPGPRSFALQVKGKSMEDEFAEGDWIVIDPDAHWQSGDYVIIGNGGEEATFKQIVREGTDWFLVPVNRQFSAQKLSADCRVIGKMVWKQPKGKAY